MVPTHKKSCRILIVEDEVTIAQLISMQLIQIEIDYSPVVIDKVTSSEQALENFKQFNYDLVLVDWMLPQLQGPDFIRLIKKQNPNCMALMLTAKSSPEDIIFGLEAGADDYMSKPFDMKVLLARVRNLLRRHFFTLAGQSRVQDQPLEVFELGELKLDTSRFEVFINSEQIHLTPSEFKLLELLVKSQGRVMSRDQLIDQIQGEDVTVTGRTIDTHIFALRKKLLQWADHIETIRGVGYRVNYTI